MKTYLQTSTSDPPIQGNGALAKHTLVCHHQGMFGCRENERKLKKMKKKKEKRETYSACISTKPKFPSAKSSNSPTQWSLYRVFVKVQYHYALKKH